MKTVWLTVTAAVFAMALLFAALANGDYAAAQTADTPTSVPTATPDDDSGVQDLPPIQGKVNPPKYPNMDSHLNTIVEQVQTGQSSAQAAASNAPVHSGASIAVTIYIIEGYGDTISDYLTDNGGDPRNIGVDYIEAYIPVSLLPDASQQEGVISVRTIIPPQPAQSSVVSEGAAAHGAPAWHDAGIKGSGVKIGVLDVGFEGLRGLMGTELPASVEARCYTDVGEFTSDLADCDNTETSKHGAAVTEVVFDIAPEATYYIANPISRGDLQATVDWMIAQDVDVINMSLSWAWTGPGDGTSIWSFSALRVADTAVASGIVWVNSAGNGAVDTWFGAFSDTNQDGWHNFTNSDNCNTIQVDESDLYIMAHLRWDDNWRGASKDLDLALFRTFQFVSPLRIPSILVGGSDTQDGQSSDIPFEEVFYSLPSAGTYCLAVGSYDGTAPKWIQLRTSGIGHELEHHTLNGSISEPADSANPGLIAVGAAPWNEPNVIDYYSSRGPTPDGRTKPEIVGASSTTTFSYSFPFSGTSAASPHVAGLAALVKQRFPEKGPEQVAEYLKDHAERRGAVPNNTWGYGFAKLPASDAPAPSPTATPGSVQPTPTPTAPKQPTPTPVSPQPTATPMPPTIPDDVLNKLSALETLLGTLQGLVSALTERIGALESKLESLDGRVAALESGASAPTPTPTPTPVAPTPTPAPGETPVPTPEPSPTQTPVADACLTAVASDGTTNGSWNSSCATDRDLITDGASVGTRYAGYYTFLLNQQSEVTITLESSNDTYLFLLSGKGKDGNIIAQNDDIDTSNYNSRIVETLAAGEYTIVATTNDLATTGDFTLTVSGIR